MGMLYEYDEEERRFLAAGLRVIDDPKEDPLTPEEAARITAAWERFKCLMPASRARVAR